MKKLTQIIYTLAIATLAIVGVSYVQAAWSNPSTAPTGGNTDAPINVGGSEQSKVGTLKVGVDGSNIGAILVSTGASLRSLYVSGGAEFDSTAQFDGGIKIPTDAGAGKVLTSDAGGNATWQTNNSCVYTNIVNASKGNNYSIQLANSSGQNVCSGDYGCRYTIWRKLSADSFSSWRYYSTGDLIYIQRPGGLSWYDSGGQSGNNGDSENTLLINTAGSGGIYDDYNTPFDTTNRNNWIFRFTYGDNVDLRVAVCPV